MLSDLKINQDGSVVGYYLSETERKQMLCIQRNLEKFNYRKSAKNKLDIDLEVWDGNKASLYKGGKVIIATQPLEVINIAIAAIHNYTVTR